MYIKNERYRITLCQSPFHIVYLGDVSITNTVSLQQASYQIMEAKLVTSPRVAWTENNDYSVSPIERSRS